MRTKGQEQKPPPSWRTRGKRRRADRIDHPAALTAQPPEQEGQSGVAYTLTITFPDAIRLDLLYKRTKMYKFEVGISTAFGDR